MEETNKSKLSNNTPNVWGMITIIFVSLINKGQLLLFLLGIILIIAVSKMSSLQVAEIGKEALKLLHEYHILGWISAILITPISVLLLKRIKRIHKAEIKKYQELLQNKKV